MTEPKYNAVDAVVSSMSVENSFQREVSFFMTEEDGVISANTNDSGGMVEFDFPTIWEKIKSKGKRTEQFYMIHSHPSGLNRMSSIDYNMVHGWCVALGEPIWFIIITEEEIVFYLCRLNKQDKTVSRDLVGTYNYWSAPGIASFSALAHMVYGLSKSNGITNVQMNNIANEINESGLKVCSPLPYLE